jgi:hypothetical protein
MAEPNICRIETGLCVVERARVVCRACRPFASRSEGEVASTSSALICYESRVGTIYLERSRARGSLVEKAIRSNACKLSQQPARINRVPSSILGILGSFICPIQLLPTSIVAPSDRSPNVRDSIDRTRTRSTSSYSLVFSVIGNLHPSSIIAGSHLNIQQLSSLRRGATAPASRITHPYDYLAARQLYEKLFAAYKASATCLLSERDPSGPRATGVLADLLPIDRATPVSASTKEAIRMAEEGAVAAAG